MPDFEQFVNGIKAVLQLIFGRNIPTWLSPLIGWCLALGLFLCGLWGILFVLSRIKDLWEHNFLPLFYNAEQKQNNIHRQRFAEHIEHEIWRLGLKEEWKDYRYAELEAEVEAEGNHPIFSLVPFYKRTVSGRRREKSLSKAIRNSSERLILVEGDPGSGKSIALRHVAQKMASSTKRSKNIKSIIPLYINLKELERPIEVAINRKLIEEFILTSLKRINDRDVDQYLDDHFEEGMKDGTWFFLFDSFDELPEVLSSTDVDSVIKSYGNAIDDFLHGMNQCRGIIASRQFRGPNYFGWPHFHIIPLTESRRYQLIRKAGLTPKHANEFIGDLGNARPEIRSMASNPLFLNLLCEYVKSGHAFPENTHTVFETYINSRLTRDEERLQRRFRLSTFSIREAAEQIAFSMAADPGLGLNPTYDNLQGALRRHNSELNDNLNTFLEALTFIKLARYEESAVSPEGRTFTFAHRRFQEYFATCTVLREPFRISARQLLTDARWRETAVAMCQMQPITELNQIIGEANQLLEEYCRRIPDLIDNPIQYALTIGQNTANKDQRSHNSFDWPSGSLHLLSLLQEGFITRLTDLPENLRIYASKIIITATITGVLFNRKWALEVSGIVPNSVLEYLLNDAFSSRSEWLKDVAYQQTARIMNISPTIAKGIREAILDLAAANRLRREQFTTKAHLARIEQSSQFLAAMKLLLLIPYIDIIFCIFVFLIMLFMLKSIHYELKSLITITILIATLLLSHYSLYVFMGPLRSVEELLFKIKINDSVKYFTFLIYYALIFESRIIIISLAFPILKFGSFAFLSIVYLVCWPVFAIWAVYYGQFVKFRWILLLPVWPIIYIIFHPISIAAYFWHHLRRIEFRDGLIGGLIILSFVVFISIMVIIANFWIYTVAKDYPTLYFLGNVIILGTTSIFLCRLIIASCYYWVRDWLNWHKWLKNPQKISCQEVCKVASSYFYPSFCIRFLRVVREKPLLIPTEEAEIFFTKLVAEIEITHSNTKRTKGVEVKNKGKLKLANAKNNDEGDDRKKTRELLSLTDPEVLDEINKILEDIQHARQGLEV